MFEQDGVDVGGAFLAAPGDLAERQTVSAHQVAFIHRQRVCEGVRYRQCIVLMFKPRHKVEFEAVFAALGLFGKFLEPGAVEVRGGLQDDGTVVLLAASVAEGREQAGLHFVGIRVSGHLGEVGDVRHLRRADVHVTRVADDDLAVQGGEFELELAVEGRLGLEGFRQLLVHQLVDRE